MATLPSGLPELVANEESLARFLWSSSQFNSIMVKPSAFLPEPQHRETSVFRHSGQPREELWTIGNEHVPQGRTVHGAALIRASDVREVNLDIIADEPPLKHAAIRNWPWIENELDRKAKEKELANLLASKAELLRK